MQVTPSPKKPALQVHVKDPIVFAHTALVLQLSVLATHSSISIKKKTIVTSQSSTS